MATDQEGRRDLTVSILRVLDFAGHRPLSVAEVAAAVGWSDRDDVRRVLDSLDACGDAEQLPGAALWVKP